MGEKKMLRKERKSPSQKREKKAIVAAKPKPRYYYYYNTPSFSCPSLSLKIESKLKKTISGLGGITKSWISPSSSCCIHQTWPQLVQINCSNKNRGLCTYSARLEQFRVIEPYSGDDRYNELAEFINAIKFQGKYYAISLQGHLALVEGSSRRLEITAFGRHRVIPRCKLTKHFREYLLEYDEDIYLVFLLSRVSINEVDEVEVYRLDSTSLEKVDRLKGDAMFFLQDDRCLGISASSLGCSKGSNCVYFTHDRADDGSWFVFDMESSCISPTSGPEIDLPIPRRTR